MGLKTLRRCCVSLLAYGIFGRVKSVVFSIIIFKSSCYSPIVGFNMAAAKTTTKKTAAKKQEDVKWETQQRQENVEQRVKKLIKLVIGLLVCTGGVWLIAIFWQSFLTIFKQWVGPVVVLIGLFIVLLGLLE